MSELPWENKKIAEIMSSVEDEKSSANTSDEKKSSTPPIPDILANAFADIPMEEAKIEISEEEPEQPDFGTAQSDFPSFGDLPDLSALAGTPQANDTPAEENEAPPELPPFMNPPSNADESGTVDAPFPFMQSDEAGIVPPMDPSPAPSPDNMENPVKKRTPPPLFEPIIDSDEVSGSPSSEAPEQALPFTLETVQSPSIESEVETQPASAPNLFAPPTGDVPPSDPFSSGVSPAESNPFAPPTGEASPDNPFASGGSPVESNPFASPAGEVPSVDPFASGDSPVESNPFAAFPEAVQSDNPFGDAAPAGAVSFEEDKQPPKIPIKLPVDVDSLKKNLEGISGITKALLKNLTKGKSLIERMEDMKGEVDVAGSERDNNELKSDTTASVSPFNENPFETPDARVNSDPFSSPFDANEHVGQETGNEPVNPFTENEIDHDDTDIRQVTPIENPIMEMKEEYLLDNDPFAESDSNDILLPESAELSAEASIPSMGAENSDLVVNDMISDAVAEDMLRDDVAEVGESINPESGVVGIRKKEPSASAEELSKKVLSKELRDIKSTTDKKFENLDGDMSGLKKDLNDMNLQFISVHAEIQDFSNKISEITESVALAVSSSENLQSRNNSRFDVIDGRFSQVESKISDFDSSISVLQSDSTSMKLDMSQVEESISELVGSYTALLAQLHESLQENESKFEVLAELSSKVDSLGPRVELIEKMQEESKATSKEFSRSMSSMVDNLGRVSSEFQEFRQESDDKNAAVLEKIDSLTEYMESELKKLGARSYKGFGQNVHLSNIVKNSSNMKLCMEWLEFLMELVGRNNLPDILSYYEELGWLTEKVRMELLNYAEGIDFYMEKPDWKLTPDDHVKSIWFIESLAGMKVDKNRLSVIERDIEKVKKGSEIYGI
ncbi:MAG: hypothetical protein PWQ51_2462 [Methanolobus sp.]|jgi:archaellum component FlaD/FlaE|nr:hypothetical protein [Methanolobus sp.]